MKITVGRLSQLLIFASLSLVGGVALGQTGLIVEPWRKASPPSVAEQQQPAPASGLLPAAPAPRKPEPPVIDPTVIAPKVQKWSPPIVELLVDPWAKSPMVAPAAQRRWVPSSVEIIDPWAGSAPAPPRLASRAPGPAGSTIF